MARAMGSMIMINVDGTDTPLQAVVYRTVYASWLTPINASLAYALTFVAFWYVILLVAEKRGFVLKV
jgi:predicted acyltransferase